VQVGILGLGSIGERHARNLLDLGHKVEFHDPRGLLDSMPRNEVIKNSDAIIICTPTVNHAEDLIDVLGAGKHVLVEKPIGYDCPPFIAGLIMGARSKHKHLVVATGFMCRFHPEVQRAKELIDAVYFGRIKALYLNVLQKNTKPDYLRDGVIRNWASHEIDIARYLLGNLTVSNAEVKLSKQGQDVELIANMYSIEHECDVFLQADYLTSPERRIFAIRGTDMGRDFNLVKGQAVWDQTYIDEMEAFIRAIDGKDPGPLADGVDGVAALQLVMDIREKAGLENEKV
jgi:predicted dehydrogenase